MEKTNGIERSEIWNSIYEIVKTLPREKTGGDAPDAISVTTSIEKLFLKLLPINAVGQSQTEVCVCEKPTKHYGSFKGLMCSTCDKRAKSAN